jgi:hypothetical protein
VSSPSGNEEFFLKMGRLDPNATPEQSADLNKRFQTAGLGKQDASWREMQKSEKADRWSPSFASDSIGPWRRPGSVCDRRLIQVARRWWRCVAASLR